VQYIDVIDVENGGAQASQTAALYASISSDVFFGAAGRAGQEALQAAAQKGAWVIGSGGDLYTTVFENGATPGADNVMTSVYFDAGAAVYNALVQYRAGTPPAGPQPFSATTGAISLAPYRTDALNALDQQDLATALARLADGSLDTGIDPATGQEK
jgi:basic membrane lipoprotein Med (substrate-binding protein (PBP1-ABC) superfamily)